MFYKIVLENMAEVTPLIYTPTVGDACLQFSHNYRRPEGMVSARSHFVRAGRQVRSAASQGNARDTRVLAAHRIPGSRRVLKFHARLVLVCAPRAPHGQECRACAERGVRGAGADIADGDRRLEPRWTCCSRASCTRFHLCL